MTVLVYFHCEQYFLLLDWEQFSFQVPLQKFAFLIRVIITWVASQPVVASLLQREAGARSV